MWVVHIFVMELQEVVSQLKWVLGTKPRSSGRLDWVLDCYTISPALSL